MKTMSFYVGDEDLERIQAEQERFAVMGIRISKSAAIRSLIQRASSPAVEAAEPPQAEEQVVNSTTTDTMHFREKGKLFT